MLFIGRRLEILGFTSSAERLVALLLTLPAGRTLFAQLERLMQQMEEGKLKAIDWADFSWASPNVSCHS